MTPDALLEFCLSLPQAIETFPFGPETSVFKTSGNGRIFALSALDGEPFSVSLKCDPEESKALREEFPRQITPGYHLDKKHWITIMLDGGVLDGGLLDGGLLDGNLRDGGVLDGGTPGRHGREARVDDELVEQLLRDSHALVRPKDPRRPPSDTAATER